ncbi:MarR family transcriptional regulator [Exiguobacterium sp. SL14]|nr:MarR family transcriptional regulator [Exiguobacterium sp. SL14]MCY1691325.1 MarR family transcriptional regulator [Exiguobacterium sp. SL14]
MEGSKKQDILTMYRRIDELDLQLAKFFAALNPFALSQQQEQLLLLFKRKDSWTSTEIARTMGISKSAVSQVLKILEERTFVKRQKNPANLRESFIHLDASGVAYLRKMDEIEEQLAEEMTTILDEMELDIINRSLVRMIDRFQDLHRS